MPSVITADSFDSIFDDFGQTTQHESDFTIVRKWMTPKSLLCPPSEEVKAASPKIKHQLDDLVDLYTNDVRSHFFAYASPLLRSLIHSDPFADKESFRLVEVLNDLKRHYYHPFEYIEVTESLYYRFKVCYTSLLNTLFTPQIFQITVNACFEGHNLCYPEQVILDAVAMFREIGKEAVLNQLILTHLLSDFEVLAKKKYENIWDRSVLQDMKSWVDKDILPSARALIPQCEDDIVTIMSNFSLEVIATIRTAELFDIVVDYPDSKPGLEDLKVHYSVFLVLKKLISSDSFPLHRTVSALH